MIPVFFNREHTRTSHIQLDSRRYKACWKCIDVYSNQIISKVDLPRHIHVLIADPDGLLLLLKS
jgi:hypothetical protein